jgi:endonuclease/exonuclease/phosphatase family metal-dependent hydrolase
LKKICLLIVISSCFSGCVSVPQSNVSATLINERHPLSEGSPASDFILHQEPEYLTYEELTVLSTNPVPTNALSEKLEAFWATPLISNQAYYDGHRAMIAHNDLQGPFIRFTTWNIEWSLFTEQAIQTMTSETAYVSFLDPRKAPPKSRKRRKALRQRERVSNSDIIILQEMDIGMPRSSYLNAAQEMATRLNMNMAFGTQALELDPVLTGYGQPPRIYGDTTSTLEPVLVDPDQYKGVFGSAILSRFPIKNVEVFQLKTKPYDWYTGEIKRTSLLEIGRRKGANALFKEGIARELKVGARNYFRIDLEVPGLPDDTLTIINIHLEIKCPPKGRARQVKEILEYIKDIPNPVIMAGDFNSAPGDVSAISLPKLAGDAAKNPSTLLSIGTKAAVAGGAMINSIRNSVNHLKNFYRPMAPNIPVVLSNKSKPMFNQIRDFRFDDGGAFDFRGDRERSINGRKAPLSNSNHKGVRGQVASFEVVRPIGPVGKQRLDWIFVKSFLQDGYNQNSPYRLAPHFGETLVDFNASLVERLSDHRPSTVDLPLEEPSIVPNEPARRRSRPVRGPHKR